MTMLSRHFQIKGNRDDYAHFLARTHNASLIEVSSPFNFEINGYESSSLILREVFVRGECSNTYHLQDAFIGLMIIYPGSGFSTEENGHRHLSPAQRHHLRWHVGGTKPIYSHHRHSRVLYLRFETCRFLFTLAQHGLVLSDVLSTSGREPSAALIRRSEELFTLFRKGLDSERQDKCADEYLQQLIVELCSLSALHRNAQQLSSRSYVCESMRWLTEHSASRISLQNLAQAINVTPRTIQVGFQKHFGLSPMRWLKLWRLGMLRRLVFRPGTSQQTFSNLILQSQLGAMSTVVATYRSIYGTTPHQDYQFIQSLDSISSLPPINLEEATYSIDEALAFLKNLKDQTPQGLRANQQITLKINFSAELGANELDDQG